MSTDWQWVYENPKEAAALIDRLEGANHSPVETAWLVEHQNDGPCWWGRTPDGDDIFGWTKDSLMALRFSRKEDAEAYIEDVGWNEAIATEHMWCAPRADTI